MVFGLTLTLIALGFLVAIEGGVDGKIRGWYFEEDDADDDVNIGDAGENEEEEEKADGKFLEFICNCEWTVFESPDETNKFDDNEDDGVVVADEGDVDNDDDFELDIEFKAEFFGWTLLVGKGLDDKTSFLENWVVILNSERGSLSILRPSTLNSCLLFTPLSLSFRSVFVFADMAMLLVGDSCLVVSMVTI